MCVDLTVTSARVHAYMLLVVGSNGMECTEKENFACFFSNNDAYSYSNLKNGSCEFWFTVSLNTLFRQARSRN